MMKIISGFNAVVATIVGTAIALTGFVPSRFYLVCIFTVAVYTFGRWALGYST